ncbi:DUF1207 domain-containing protein [bacterium]|jgi:hypothetical protein|nr:DUF1207 domain-containing protein [bacterium]
MFLVSPVTSTVIYAQHAGPKTRYVSPTYSVTPQFKSVRQTQIPAPRGQRFDSYPQSMLFSEPSPPLQLPEPEAILAGHNVSTRPTTVDTVNFQSSLDSCNSDCWTFQRLPDGLVYKSYLAGEKEPRFASFWAELAGHGYVWDSTLGGRVGLLRYGTTDNIKPQGWQLDMEGAAMPRLDMESKNDLVAVDFRFGAPITYRNGPTSYKFGYYHISSHVGDEFMENNPAFVRDHFVREALVAAISHEPSDFVRLYGEIGYSVIAKGSAEPIELQFGAEYSAQAATGIYSSPFAAVNAHLRQEANYGGNVTVQAGWQWRGVTSDRLWRMGFQYYNGATSQYVLGLDDEELYGFGMWFDY